MKSHPAGLTEHTITVLLVDDQAIIGEAVRRMLQDQPDISFHYCSDPTRAVRLAEEIAPTIILQDLVMPDVDGLTLVKFFRANEKTRDIPLIVLSTREEAATKAEAFALGANDYLVKLPDKIELLARIRYHSRGYINLLQRNEAWRALVASQKTLAAELAEAAAYVHSLLPPPLADGPVLTEWSFVPSTQLGGDALGYHWLDDDHFSLFLLDVCGHGVGAALLSISAMNVLRSQALPAVDFREPAETLSALNEAFLMEKHNNMYFTIWYGVYRKSTRTLRYASAGHPPALLLAPEAGGLAARELRAHGMVLGGLPGMRYTEDSCVVPGNAVIFLVSDGTYEIIQTNGRVWTYREFATFLQQAAAAGRPEASTLLQHVRTLHGEGPLDDDFTLLKLCFPAS